MMGIGRFPDEEENDERFSWGNCHQDN
jgi:hypothetical protein